ncbi:HIR1 [Candida oxycetoniae]|uniref:Protein HIR n=1 Tax=Candida oxycetoniae TaxID=497107 RepID=A0AAI9WVS5_9ASCO|nr:HIR1 [Candida oxycetoniae]KAI3402375.2 HIR1 [Candida oxycetoniae]
MSDKPYTKSKKSSSSTTPAATAAAAAASLSPTSALLDAEQTPDLPDKSLRRPLCSMSRHNGVVTSLKFSPDGRWLASGSDDKIVLIWEKDNDQRPKSFGVEQEDLEHWTVRKRLVAHDNDIQDICWSPDGNLLVTVGLDRSIIIWNALTFERIKRYDIHQSMVKGIVFDPANKFFATASDDRTVRIFRYYKKLNEYNKYEFQMEHVVVDPFKKSPLTSYFRRMSWSPDGQHIAVPNATNGPVPSVAIINRGNWGSDVSLIGHEAPVEVCSFSPSLFQVGSTSNKEEQEPKFQTVLATGGQDRTLAVWSTYNSKPIVVCSDIVYNSITDICWAPDGETLYFSCLDGSITCVRFDKGELGFVVSTDLIDKQLNRYGTDRESTILPESVEQLLLEEKSRDTRALAIRQMMPVNKSPKKPVDKKVEATSVLSPSQTLVPAKTIDTARLRKQAITITKSGKKRVAPLLVSSSSSSTPISAVPLSTGNFEPSIATSKKYKRTINSKLSYPNYTLSKLGLQTAVCGIKKRDTDTTISAPAEEEVNDYDDMGGANTLPDEANTAQLSEAALRRLKNRQKRKWLESKYPSSFKEISHLPENLFSNVALQNVEIGKIYKAYANNKDISGEISTSSAIDFDEDLLFSVVFQKTSYKQRTAAASVEVTEVAEGAEGAAAAAPIPISMEEGQDNLITTTIEIRNGKPWHEDDPEQEDRDFDDPTKVIVYDNDQEKRRFVLFFPFRIQSVLPIVEDNSLKYYVLCSFNGSIQIISASTGRYILPAIELHENVVFLKYGNGHLLVLTSSGLFYGWNLKTMKIYLNKVAIANVLNNLVEINESSKHGVISPTVKAVDINLHDGTPYVMTDVSNDIYGYSLDLNSWIKVIDSWYFNVDESIPHQSNKNKALGRVLIQSKLNYKKDALLGNIYTYKFSTNQSKKLQDVMIMKSKEMMEMIQ